MITNRLSFSVYATCIQLDGGTGFSRAATPSAHDPRPLPGKQRNQLFSERPCRQDVEQEITGVVKVCDGNEDGPDKIMISLLHWSVTYIYPIVLCYSAKDRSDICKGAK